MRRSSRAAANSAMKRAKQSRTLSSNRSANRWLNGDHNWALNLKRFRQSVFSQIITVFVAAASVVALGWTLWSINDDLQYRAQERKNWRLDRIDRAWNRVLRTATGNTGKGESLSYLLTQNTKLNGTNLSCEKMGGWENGKCAKRVVITDFAVENIKHSAIAALDIIKYFPGGRINEAIDLSGAEIVSPIISNSEIIFTLNQTIIRNAKFTNSFIFIRDENGMRIFDSTFANTVIGSVGSAKISDSNISDAYFFGETSGIENSFATNWFWAISPPKCSFFSENLFALTDYQFEKTKRDAIINYDVRKSLFKICNFVRNKTVSICSILSNRQQISLREFQRSATIERDTQPSFFEFSRCARIETKDNIELPLSTNVQALSFDQAAFLFPGIYK